MIALGYVEVFHIPGKDNPANIGTKTQISVPDFLRERDYLTQVIDFPDDRDKTSYNDIKSKPLT